MWTCPDVRVWEKSKQLVFHWNRRKKLNAASRPAAKDKGLVFRWWLFSPRPSAHNRSNKSFLMQALVLPGWSFGVAVPWPGHVSPGPGGGWEFAFLAWSKLLERDNVHNGMLEGELKRKKRHKSRKKLPETGEIECPVLASPVGSREWSWKSVH